MSDESMTINASRNLTDMLNDVSMAARDIEQVIASEVPVATLVEIGEQREKDKAVMGRMVGAMGKIYHGFKEYSASRGLVMPSTPARITSTPSPTPGIVDPNTNRCFSPILPPGLEGKATMGRPGKVWMGFREPPAGNTVIPKRRMQRWDVGPVGQYLGRDGGKRAGVATPSVPVAGPYRPRVDTSRPPPGYDLREKLADKVNGRQEGKDGDRVREEDKDKDKDIREEEEEEQDDQMRRLGGACAKCREVHDTEMCPYNPRDLYCTYPPCTMRSGHVAGACHELTKICYLRVCKRARGHRASCHFEPEGRAPYGATVKAAEELEQVFKEHVHLLTYQEKEALDLLGVGGRQGGGPDRRARDSVRYAGPYVRGK